MMISISVRVQGVVLDTTLIHVTTSHVESLITGVGPAIVAIPGFEYSWLPSAATIENRKIRRPDPDLVRSSM